MYEVQRNTGNSVMVYMADAVDHVSGKTGLALSVSLSKAGGAFAVVSPIVTERGSGWYNIDLTTANCDTPGELVATAKAAGADPAFKVLFVVDYLSISVSEISICNMALARCGVTMFIESTSEASQQADLCNLFYVPTRDKVLQAMPWPFARKNSLLAGQGTPPSRWKYSYGYPSDCLKVRRLVQYGAGGQDVGVSVPFEIGETEAGAVILTDLSNAEIEYTARINDLTLFPQTFIDVLAWALTAELAIPLTTDVNRAQLAQKMYAQALPEAFKTLDFVDNPSGSMSEIAICNMALAHCGFPMSIKSVGEASQQANICNLFYASVRDKVLQAMPWTFARKYAALKDLGSPPQNLGFRYLYPVDCLKFRNIVNNGYLPFSPGFYPGFYADESVCLPVRVPYQIGLAADGSSRVIYTNVADAQAEYTVKITDVTLFPQTFITALAWALAAEIAVPLTTDMNRAQLAQNKYVQSLLEAGADAMNEGVDGPAPESDFIRARR